MARVVAEIERDMALDAGMMRLFSDVGRENAGCRSGGALRAIAHGGQVALMAPTEFAG